MNWEMIYRRKVTDPETAMTCIQSGQRLYLGGGAGVPRTLIPGLMAVASTQTLAHGRRLRTANQIACPCGVRREACWTSGAAFELTRLRK